MKMFQLEKMNWYEDNMANDVNTIETGLGEKNVDESVTVNECDDEQSFSKDIGTTTEPNEALPIPMLFVRYNKLIRLHLRE